MVIHGSKEHRLDIVKEITKFFRRAKKRAVKTALFEFCFWLEQYYIRTTFSFLVRQYSLIEELH